MVGLQLIDRNDELGLLQEKKKILVNILNQGDQALQARNEEIRCLELQLSELSRRLEVCFLSVRLLSSWLISCLVEQVARKQLPSTSTYEV